MKKTFITITITVILTWFTFSVIQAVRTGVERVWMTSAIKSPGAMAIAEIQNDMNAGRFNLAKVKIQKFSDVWKRFESGPDSCSGLGIGSIMLEFSKIHTNPMVGNQLDLSPALK